MAHSSMNHMIFSWFFISEIPLSIAMYYISMKIESFLNQLLFFISPFSIYCHDSVHIFTKMVFYYFLCINSLFFPSPSLSTNICTSPIRWQIIEGRLFTTGVAHKLELDLMCLDLAKLRGCHFFSLVKPETYFMNYI